ncbi:hypothetical protein G9A89_023128 [Geosiphon pyriformis]|nr:hypothetical protein G9A89_023128 [Geosiphon pyriformis]
MTKPSFVCQEVFPTALLCTGTKWYFIMYTPDGIYSTSGSEYQINLTKSAVKENPELLLSYMKRVIAIIVGLLKDLVSVDNSPASKSARIKKPYQKVTGIETDRMKETMRRNFYFVVILLVTISMINPIPLDFYTSASPSTSQSFTPLFEPCNGVPRPDFITVTTEPETFAGGEKIKITAKGIADKIISSATLYAGFSDAKNDDIGSISKNLCHHLEGGQSCPIAPRIKFSVSTHVRAPRSIIGTAFVISIVEGSKQLFCAIARLD